MVDLDQDGIDQFQQAVVRMPDLLQDLMVAPRHAVAEHSNVPNSPGVYLFSESGTPIYVGQSRKLRQRLLNHTVLSSRQNQASFAFNIAKRDAGEAGLDVARFRQILEADADFAEHFVWAKTRVAAMDVQFIELADPIERTMFEVYASLALVTTKFNKFETH